jgi:thioredoxin reductase
VPHYDVLIVGGGPAGLSAGLWLARFRHQVRILDSGRPRNQPTWAVHGYPGITDPPPHELRRVLITQATAAGAEWQACDVVSIEGEKNAFTLSLDDNGALTARRVVLAYGRRDVIPEIEGLAPLYGKSVFHCPDCDGPSMVDCRLGVIGWDMEAAAVALYLLTWGQKVTLLTHGRTPKLRRAALGVLAKYGIDIIRGKIARLSSKDGRLAAAEFEDGDALPLDGLFFHLGSLPASDLAHHLGCKRDADGNLEVNNANETSVPGVYAAGDLIGPPYLAVSAAAAGVKTALAVHKSLLPRDHELSV